MHLRMSIALSLAVAVSVTACQLPLSVKRAVSVLGQEGTIRRAPIAGVAIRGTLMAPAGLIANNSAGLVSNNSAGLISNNGSGLIGKTKTYRVAGLSESPLADAEVFLATADGRPVPGIAAVRTDAQGNFVFPRVPKGFAFVAASPVTLEDGTEGQLATLVKAADNAAQARISLASTLVTAAIVRGQAGTVGDFSPKAFDQALAATALRLEPADVAKVSDQDAAADKVEEVAKDDKAVQNALTTLKQEVAAPQKSLDELQTVVETINAQPSSAPAPTAASKAPAPGASVTPSPGASAVASPGASAAPSPTPSTVASTAASTAPSSVPSSVPTGGLTVATLAGKAYTSGNVEGTGKAALFNGPVGIAVASDGSIFVADSDNHRIRKITPAGVVTAFAGSGSVGLADGQGAAASFSQPWGMAIDAHDTLYVADNGNHTIRTITPDGTVSTLAGNGTQGKANGVGAAARFNGPKGLCVANGTVYVADSSNQLIRVIAANGTVSTLAGSSYNFADGKGAAAAFRNPSSLAMGTDGTLYVADGNNYAIRAITPDGTVSTIAGMPAVKGRADGTGNAARFEFLQGMTWANGRLLVCDQLNHSIRAVTPAGVVTTLAGTGFSGATEGAAATAQFRQPRGVTMGANGTIYVSDSMNHTVRTIR